MEKRYDKEVDRYYTLEQWVWERLPGLPNEEWLAEIWRRLPLNK